jgi:hypothetical protein
MTYAEATERLKKHIMPDGGLFSLGWYLLWHPNDPEACLDGDFTADDLLAIAIYMRGPEKE